MILEITGCTSCPCCQMLDMGIGYLCKLKKFDEKGELLYINESYKTYQAMTPEWCPLKKESITFEFKK